MVTATAAEDCPAPIPVLISDFIEASDESQRLTQTIDPQTGEPGQAARLLDRKRRRGRDQGTERRGPIPEMMPESGKEEEGVGVGPNAVDVDGSLALTMHANLGSAGPVVAHLQVVNKGGVPATVTLTSTTFPPATTPSPPARPPIYLSVDPAPAPPAPSASP